MNDPSLPAAYQVDITGKDLWPPVLESDRAPAQPKGKHVMPRFFFNIRDGRDIPDKGGTVLPDADAARRSAVVAMGEAIKDYSHEFWGHPEWGNARGR